MPNPATLAARANQDKRIPDLDALPPGTDPATLTVPVYNPATDLTHQSPVSGPAPNSNAIIGGPKLVQYVDSRYYGVPAGALTLDRLTAATIVPGTLSTVDNPSTRPLALTEPPRQYLATLVPAGTAGAVLVPRYIGAAAGDTVPINWREVTAPLTAQAILAHIDVAASAVAGVQVSVVNNLLVFGVSGTAPVVPPSKADVYTATYDSQPRKNTADTLFAEVADLTTRVNAL